MTDAAFLYHVLEDGRWHGQAQILARSMAERGHGLTVHSRAADLRKKGCVVECELRRNGHGRTLSYYRMSALSEPAGAAAVGTVSSLAGSESVPSNPSDRVRPSCPVDSPPLEPQTPMRDGGTLKSISPQRGDASGDETIVEDLSLSSEGSAQAPRLFACEIDESAGLRGAYGTDAA